MASYLGGVIMLAIGILMVLYGKARNGVPRDFLRSYPFGIAYIMTSMVLMVYGLAWIVMASI